MNLTTYKFVQNKVQEIVDFMYKQTENTYSVSEISSEYRYLMDEVENLKTEAISIVSQFSEPYYNVNRIEQEGFLRCCDVVLEILERYKDSFMKEDKNEGNEESEESEESEEDD